MLKKLKQHSNEGFTIIEVLIVLAIAALILLIVFLAVPALQRSARNTQRKNDAAAMGGAIANYISNNGGTLPTEVGSDVNMPSTNVAFIGGTTTTNTESAKLGYYTVDVAANVGMGMGAACSGNIGIVDAMGTVVTPMAVPSPGTACPDAGTGISTEQLLIVTGETCDSTGTQGGTVNPRTAALFYVTENGSNSAGNAGSLQCIEQ